MRKCYESHGIGFNNVKVTRILYRRPKMFLITFSLLVILLIRPRDCYTFSSSGDIRVDVKIPKEGEFGKSVSLECTWKLLSNNSLYSVKWYKDEYEFFSYNPENEPENRIKFYPQNGVTMDVKSSNKNLIRLTHLTLNSSGQYKCEVSTGAPYFATNYVEGNLSVIILPSQGPEIMGLASYYAVGDNVTANCTSWPSVPMAKLHWSINNKTVPAEYTIDHPPLKPIKNQGIPNSVGLLLELKARHFSSNGGALRLRCFARVGSHRFEVERRIVLVHANNQRFSAFDLRNRAACPHLSILELAILVLGHIVVTT